MCPTWRDIPWFARLKPQIHANTVHANTTNIKYPFPSWKAEGSSRTDPCYVLLFCLVSKVFPFRSLGDQSVLPWSFGISESFVACRPRQDHLQRYQKNRARRRSCWTRCKHPRLHRQLWTDCATDSAKACVGKFTTKVSMLLRKKKIFWIILIFQCIPPTFGFVLYNPIGFVFFGPWDCQMHRRMSGAFGLCGIPWQLPCLMTLPCLAQVLDRAAVQILQGTAALKFLEHLLVGVNIIAWMPLAIGFVGIVSGVRRNKAVLINREGDFYSLTLLKQNVDNW